MLATVSEVRDWLKIETTAFDAQLQNLLDDVYSALQGYVRRPLGLELSSEVFERPLNAGVVPIRSLFLSEFPLAVPGDSAANYSVSDALELTDGDGTLVPTTDYRVDTRYGVIRGVDTFVFDTWPYTAVYAWGLGARADYDPTVLRALRLATQDLCSEYWSHRTPSATQEMAGGGVLSQYEARGLTARVQSLLKPYRLTRIG